MRLLTARRSSFSHQKRFLPPIPTDKLGVKATATKENLLISCDPRESNDPPQECRYASPILPATKIATRSRSDFRLNCDAFESHSKPTRITFHFTGEIRWQSHNINLRKQTTADVRQARKHAKRSARRSKPDLIVLLLPSHSLTSGVADFHP